MGRWQLRKTTIAYAAKLMDIDVHSPEFWRAAPLIAEDIQVNKENKVVD
ncbi:hypothetical protein [Paenibacillus sp. HW567]|nr:hypothetical protein [Paenibacillus sp. HW567]